MFEHRNEPLLPLSDFRLRVVRFLLIAVGVTFVWTCVGAAGFYLTEGMSIGDALYNSAMVVSDMGPVYFPVTAVGKVFAGIYALASGLVFIGAIGVAFAPIIHRFFHYFHLDKHDEEM